MDDDDDDDDDGDDDDKNKKDDTITLRTSRATCGVLAAAEEGGSARAGEKSCWYNSCSLALNKQKHDHVKSNTKRSNE